METNGDAHNRAGNFTEDEIEILVLEATQRKEIITAKLGANITKLRKQR